MLWAKLKKLLNFKQNVPLGSNQAFPGDYCVKLLKSRDREHFITSLALPATYRSGVMALRACSCEIASLGEGQATVYGDGPRFRLQFWIDAVESIYNFGGIISPNYHPVILALAHTVKKHNISRELLLRLVSSRNIFVQPTVISPFKSIDEMENYAVEAFGCVNLLMLECAGVIGANSGFSKSVIGHAKHAAIALGKAEGLITILRGIPYNASRRRLYLPSDRLATVGISKDSIFRLTHNSSALAVIIQEIAARAQQHLDGARFRRKYLQNCSSANMVLNSAAIVDDYLYRLSLVNCDVFHSKIRASNPWLPFTVMCNKYKNTF